MGLIVKGEWSSMAKKRSRARRTFMALGMVGVLLVCLAAGAGVGVIAGYLRNAPSIEDVALNPSISTKVYDANGELITKFFIENRTWVPLSNIPKHAQLAVLAAEDDEFYSHHGIDLKAIARAVLVDIMHRSFAQGGSTITQQLAKLAFLYHDKKLTRKLQEVLYAFQLERRYTKDEILEFYLNMVYYNHGAYGIETASQLYFGKPAAKLTLAEAALLAGIPKSPGYYSPYVNPERAKERRDWILGRMLELGWIDRNTYEQAKAEPIRLVGLKHSEPVAPYFVDMVRDYLVDRYGADVVYRSGLKVYTTLDLRLQRLAEKTLAESVPVGRTDEKGLSQPQVAMVVMDPHTGYIKALVGGRGQDKFNRAVHGLRQVGSVMKVFVYTAAIDKGYTPATVIMDEPVEYRQSDGRVWAPQNVTGKFEGPTTLRQALERSVNVVAVKLADQIGIDTVIDYAKRMGISTLVESGPRNDRTLSLALGGLTKGISPLEITAAYGVLANQGIKADPMFIVRVEDARGTVLEEHRPHREIVLDEKTAYIVTDMLREVIEGSRGTGKRANIGRPAAGKTGTSSDYTNAWFVGYTPELVAGVWIGEDIQSRKMSYKGIGNITSSMAAAVWGKFMSQALAGVPVKEFPVPAGITYDTRVCTESGKLATPSCPPELVRTEVFVKGSEPTEFCDIHSNYSELIRVPICTESNARATEYCPKDSVVVKTFRSGDGMEVLPDGSYNPDSFLPTSSCTVHGPTAPAYTGDQYVEVLVCKESGQLATEYCPDKELQRYVRGSEPKEYCTIHVSAPGVP